MKVSQMVGIKSNLKLEPVLNTIEAIWIPGLTGAGTHYEQVQTQLQNNSIVPKDIERELRIAKLQEHASLTPGQIIELEILLNKKWK